MGGQMESQPAITESPEAQVWKPESTERSAHHIRVPVGTESESIRNTSNHNQPVHMSSWLHGQSVLLDPHLESIRARSSCRDYAGVQVTHVHSHVRWGYFLYSSRSVALLQGYADKPISSRPIEFTRASPLQMPMLAPRSCFRITETLFPSFNPAASCSTTIARDRLHHISHAEAFIHHDSRRSQRRGCRGP